MNRQKYLINMLVALAILFTAAFPTLAASAATINFSGAEQVSATLSDPVRINFATGATSAVVTGNLAANTSVQYVLRALAYQLMDVSLSAPEGVTLKVTTASGSKLTGTTSSSTSFRGYLPRTGDYVLKITSGSQAISYSVSVTIPERVSFKSGATSAKLKGTVKAGQSHDYILRALKGQLMEVNVAPVDSLKLVIYGVDGTVLRSGMGEGSSYRGELPLTEDYIVTVRAGDKDVTYTLDVIIPARISFARGAYSAAVNGWVNAESSQYYVLRAMKDQTMQVKVTSSKSLQLIVYGSNGASVKNELGENASFKGVLPTTQDYIVIVKAGASSAYYTLSVAIK